jgi:hypothetical protein
VEDGAARGKLLPADRFVFEKDAKRQLMPTQFVEAYLQLIAEFPLPS